MRVFYGGTVLRAATAKHFDLNIYTDYEQFADSVIRVQTDVLILSRVLCAGNGFLP